MKKQSLLFFMVVVLGLSSMGCSLSKQASPLDPNKPITVTLWHYYNASIKESFDALVSAFNETIGLEEGIVIEAQSQGDVNQLATAVFEAANKSIGAPPMPDIFAAYADNAFRVHQITPLLPLNTYFTADELKKYRLEFLEEGALADGNYYIMPIAKSTENLYIIKSTWEAFAGQNGFTTEDLATWEGLNKVAKAYYEQRGKGFFSLDANANFFIVSGMQFKQPLYTTSEAGTTFQLPPDVAKRIWSYYYAPYIQGYFLKTGRFSSDDAKTGRVIAYTGSTAGAAYFPAQVENADGSIEAIEPLILPYPYFQGADKVAIQQGAGMSIVKSDAAHEYAASLFLKWLTEPQQNLKFAVSTGYLPVQETALQRDQLLSAAKEDKDASPSILTSLETTAEMLQSHQFYNNPPFEGSFDMRRLLETHLFEKIQRDLAFLDESVKAGKDRDQVIADLLTEDAFNLWYNQLHEEAQLILQAQ